MLLSWARENGAQYAELNYGGDERRKRFWQSVGFRKNGADEWCDPLMLLPPNEDVPVTIEILTDPEEWQLRKLENGYLQEIGEEPLEEEKQERLSQAIRDGRITFFMAKRGHRAVGMCSVVQVFSTFACCNTGILEDFYIEPVFRGKGIARMLARAVQNWGKDKENWFSLKGNRRLRATTASGPGQICYTNPEVVKSFIAQLKNYIASDIKRFGKDRAPEIYSVTPNDNGDHCECKIHHWHLS